MVTMIELGLYCLHYSLPAPLENRLKVLGRATVKVGVIRVGHQDPARLGELLGKALGTIAI